MKSENKFSSSAPEKWLDAMSARINKGDRLADSALHALVADARAALALRDELDECRAKIAEMERHEQQTHATLGAILGTDTSLEDAAKRMAAKLAQAEQERDEARKESLKWMAHVDTADHEGMAHMEAAAASQARERELREAGEALRVAVSEGAKYEDWVAACGQFLAAIARPCDYSALREMLAKAVDQADLECGFGATDDNTRKRIVDKMLGEDS